MYATLWATYGLREKKFKSLVWSNVDRRCSLMYISVALIINHFMFILFCVFLRTFVILSRYPWLCICPLKCIVLLACHDRLNDG